MKKVNFWLLLSSILFIFASCDNNSEDVNPNSQNDSTGNNGNGTREFILKSIAILRAKLKYSYFQSYGFLYI